ncbi:MAG: TIGR02266 family protein [Deltaproteobacteria bacterium]|nr:TIGR02266 family protein [Deltaproteobacteria bacterium]
MGQDDQDRRQHTRVYVGLLVRVRYENVEQFVENFATNISAGGIFIQSRKLYPAGTLLKFEIQLKSGQSVLRGRGKVAWAREPSLPGAQPQLPGMGVRFTQLDEDSRRLIRRMIDKKKTEKQFTADESADLEDLDVEIEAPAPERPPTIEIAGDLTSERYESVGQAGLELDVSLDDVQAPAPSGQSAAMASGGSSSRYVIGIDLGTTNSCAAIVRDGHAHVIPSRRGYRTIPSIVAYDDKGRLLVGHPAKNQMELNPKNTIYGSKRLIGRPFDSPALRQIRDRFHYEIVEGPKNQAAVKIVGQVFSLQQVAAFILSEIRDIAREMLGEEVNRAVVTVPAYYNENQRQAVREAGILAGLHIERIVNEPTAAALAFGYNRGLDQRVLVYDLGGGTFDASVLELCENVYEVMATGGDTFLGGVDFDNQLVDYLLQEFCKQVGCVPEMDRSAMQRLRDAAEQAKCALSEKHETIVRLPFFAAVKNTPKDLEVRVSREMLEDLCRPLVERTLRVAAQVMKQAGLRPQQLDNILLVGGQSRMPLVWRLIQEVFGRQPSSGVHPDEAVAIGAALLADSVGRIDSVVLIDVLPLSIGIGLPGGGFLPVLQAGTALPATKSYTISTFKDMQTRIELLIFQGDNERLIHNEYLGTLVIGGIQPGPKGANQIEITFSLDQECLLKINARNRTREKVLDAQLKPLDNEVTIRQKLRIPENEKPGQADAAAEAETAKASAPAQPTGLLGRLFSKKGS